eukprot:gene12753-biopygen14045
MYIYCILCVPVYVLCTARASVHCAYMYSPVFMIFAGAGSDVSMQYMVYPLCALMPLCCIYVHVVPCSALTETPHNNSFNARGMRVLMPGTRVSDRFGCLPPGLFLPHCAPKKR